MDINDIGSLIGGTMRRVQLAKTPEEKELLKTALNYFQAAKRVAEFGHPQLARSLMAFGERTLLKLTIKDISKEPWPADVVQIMPWLDRSQGYPARPQRPNSPGRNFLYSLYDKMEDRIARFTDGIEDWMDRTFQTVRPKTSLDRLIFDLSGKNVKGGPPQKITSQGVNKATGVVMTMLRRPMPPEQKAILKDALANLTLARSLLDMGLPEYGRIFVAIAEMRVCNISPEIAQKTGYAPNPVLKGIHVPDVVVPDEPEALSPRKAAKAAKAAELAKAAEAAKVAKAKAAEEAKAARAAKAKAAEEAKAARAAKAAQAAAKPKAPARRRAPKKGA